MNFTPTYLCIIIFYYNTAAPPALCAGAYAGAPAVQTERKVQSGYFTPTYLCIIIFYYNTAAPPALCAVDCVQSWLHLAMNK